jgi:uncharacterized damage-inducible protein DinB
MRSSLLTVAILLFALPAVPQSTDANPYTSTIRRQFNRIAGVVTRAIEKMPDEQLSFRPTPDVRTFAEIGGHIADGNFLLCRAAHENKFEIMREHEHRPGTKADLLAALKRSIEYCEAAFDATTDANGTAPVKVGENSYPKLMVLDWAVSHSWEHYGNLVTYMRMKGIVPPTSEGAPPR